MGRNVVITFWEDLRWDGENSWNPKSTANVSMHKKRTHISPMLFFFLLIKYNRIENEAQVQLFNCPRPLA